MKNTPSPVVRALHALEDYSLSLVLVVMVGLAFMQIVLRKFNVSLIWADPVLRHLVLLVTLVGAMVASREHNHISIDIVSRFVPSRVRKMINILCDGFATVVCAILTKATFMMFLDEFNYQRGGYLVDHIPLWFFQLLLPVAFGVISLRYLRFFLVSIKDTFSGEERPA